MTNRIVEIFTAGCPYCDEALTLVQGMICPSCELHVLDLRTDPAAQAKAKQYSVKRIPAIVVNGLLADCCQLGAIDANRLRALGVGTPT